MKINFFLLIIIVALVLGIAISARLTPVKNILNKTVYPISFVLTKTSARIGDFFALIKSIGNLAKENSILKKNNAGLESELADLKEIKNENEILKKELGFYETQKEYDLIPARIVGRSPTAYLPTLKISRGENDGIKKGAVVLAQGYMVGRISNTTHSTSEVEMIISSRSIIPIIFQESRATGLLKGGLAGLTAEDVAIDSLIKTGEMVVTSGLEEEIPSKIPIGKVDKIISGKSEILQRATIDSPLDFNKLEIVFVIK